MDGLSFLLADVVATGGALTLIVAWQQLVVRSRWIVAGQKTGLTASYPWGGVPRLDGEVLGGLTVSVVGDVAKPATIVVRGLPSTLRMTKARAASTATGDTRFDNVVNVDESVFMCALLDKPARRSLEQLVDRFGWIENGELHCALPIGRETATIIAERVGWAIELAQHVSREIDVPAALAKNATQDEVSVREKCLRLLVENFRDRETTALACRRATRDVMPSVRLIAALGLGQEGAPLLAELVRSEWVPREIATKAIAYAAEKLPLELARPTIMAAVKHPASIVRAQAIHSIARMGWREPLPFLIEESRREDPLCKTALAGGLAKFPSPESEYALIELLEADPVTRLAAIQSLGEIGGVSIVETLLPLTAGVLADSEQKRAATDAIKKIQARQIGAGAGQLSVTEADGHVSLAHDAAGDLAFAEHSGALALAKKS